MVMKECGLSEIIIYSSLQMYGQKFNPYGKFPSKNSQMYEEDYEQEESEPMIEEVDANYEPTDREVREYAVQTLGMVLPEDEGLLYLAREGLKAPLPPNWVPYQSRDGEVYYKHRITQEKTYDHPTDIEYKKKYEQQKEKMARKNLKSMNMKGSTGLGGQLGINPNSNLYSNPSNLFPSKANNSNLLSGSSNLNQTSTQPPTAVKLDPKVEEQLGQQLQMLQERLKKQWREFQGEEREKHQRKIKKQKQEHQAELDRLSKGKGSDVKLDDKLRAQKEKILQRIKQQLGSNMLLELKEYQRAQESKLTEFRSVYEEDNNLKVNKYQIEKDHQFVSKQSRSKENAEKAARIKELKKKQREEVLAQLKLQFQQGQNSEIEQATLQTLEQELNAVRQSYAAKIKEKEVQLEQEYDQTRRILGFDQNAYLSELASKKTRMKSISQLKIESIKKKEMQSVEAKFSNDYEEAAARLKEKLEVEYAKKLAEEKLKQQQRLTKQKLKIDEQLKLKTEAELENVYDELRLKVKEYEATMNKKLSTLSQKFIKDIQGKSRGPNNELSVRLQLKQKEITLQNKSQMISSLKRQQQLERITHSLLLLQQQLYKSRDSHQIDMKLMRQAKKYDLEYRTQQYLQYECIFKEMKNKYKKDKEFLASAMNSLQNYNRGTAIGSAAVLKQYNQDVRIMRENDQMLKKFQMLLKKAEINDKAALGQLSKNQIEYKDIQLKGQIGTIQQMSAGFQELPEQNMAPKRQMHVKGQDIDSALREHSKFLTTMRQQLNRKLYRLRGTTYY